MSLRRIYTTSKENAYADRPEDDGWCLIRGNPTIDVSVIFFYFGGICVHQSLIHSLLRAHTFLQRRSQLQQKQAETTDIMNQYRATDNDYNQKKDILTKILKDAERERLDVPVTLEEVKDALDEAENLVNFVTIEKLQEQLEDAGEETLMIRCGSRPTAQERRGSRIG